MISMYVSSDHRDWDETLGAITFAYNTSRQDSTRFTPFYLLYGREAKTPMDITFGVPPIIPGNEEDADYPVRLAKTLKKARDVVITRMQRVHEEQKREYDKGRRNVIFKVGQLVLFYKPIRKIGRAEKLLHRWHGPFEVIRQVTPVNYEAKLIGDESGNSEVFHVVAMKPFRLPSDPTNRNEPPELDTNLFPRPGKRGRPKKNLEGSMRDNRRGTRINTTENLPKKNLEGSMRDNRRGTRINTTENSLPTGKRGRPKAKSKVGTTPSALENGDSARPRRKLETGSRVVVVPPDPDHRSARPRRQARAPDRLGFHILALLCFLTCASGKLVHQTDGVFFLKDNEILFTDSDWIVSTDITFGPVQTLFTSLKSEIEEKLLRHPIVFDDNALTAKNKTTEPERPKNSLLESNLQYLRAAQILALHVRNRTTSIANNTLFSLASIQNRFNEVMDTLNATLTSTRDNLRGLIDLGGKALKWLFGTPSNEDLETINTKLVALAGSNEAIVNVLEEQAFNVNETIWTTKLNTDAVHRIAVELDSLRVTLDEMVEVYGTLADEYLPSLVNMMMTDGIMHDVNRILEWLDQYVDNLSLGIATLALHRVPPQLIPPQQLRKVLQKISDALPPNWGMASAAYSSSLWLFYQETRVSTAIVGNALRLFLQIPVFDYSFLYDVYHGINVPVYSKNASMGLQHDSLLEYIREYKRPSKNQARLATTINSVHFSCANCCGESPSTEGY